MAHKGKPPIVEVEWLDALTEYKQKTFRKACERVTLTRRLTVGYLVRKDRECMIVAGTYDPPVKQKEEDAGCDFTIIPRGWVVSVTELSPSSPESAKPSES